MATKSPLFCSLLVHCLPLLGRAILVSQLPCLLLHPFAFPPSPRHHDACILCFEAQIVSCVGAGRSPPQFCGYWVNPAASCIRILPRARVRLGAVYVGEPAVEVRGPCKGYVVCSFVAFDDCCQRSLVTGGGLGDATAMARPGVLGGNDRRREREIEWD